MMDRWFIKCEREEIQVFHAQISHFGVSYAHAQQ